MLRRRAFLAAAALAFASFVAEEARATVLYALNVEDLATTSDAIVVGRVVRTEARSERLGIITHVTVAVDDWWAGEDVGGARGPTVELCVHGGRVGDHAEYVDGQATFAPGEDVVVFLFRGGGALWPQGMSQGKWLLRRDAASGVVLAGSQADARALVRRDARGALVPVPTADARPTLTLDALRARVRAARGE